VPGDVIEDCRGILTICAAIPFIFLITLFFLVKKFPIAIGIIFVIFGVIYLLIPYISALLYIHPLLEFLLMINLVTLSPGGYFIPAALIIDGSLFIISGLLDKKDRKLDEQQTGLSESPGKPSYPNLPADMKHRWATWKKTIFVSICVLIILAPTATIAVVNNNLERQAAMIHYNRGLAYSDQGDYANAIIEYGKAIKIRSAFADAYFYRGLAHLSTKPPDIREFYDDFDRVIQHDPNYAMAYYYRGVFRIQGANLLLNDKRFFSSIRDAQDSAIKDFSHYLKIDPNNDLVYNFRGLSYFIENDLDSAIRDFNQAIELNHGSAIAYNNRGLAYARKHDLNRAISDYDEAIHLNPYFGAAYYNRGQAHYDKGDLDLAIIDWDRALQVKPDTWSIFNPGYVYYYRCEVYNSLGLAYFHKDELDLTINEFDQAINDQICPISVNFNRAVAYFYKGLYSQSLTSFKLIEPEDIDGFQYHYYHGLVNYYTDNQTNAISDFKWVIIFSHNYSLLDMDWSGNIKVGDLNSAISGFDKAIQLYPNEPLAYFFRGLTYSMNGETENAIADLYFGLKLCIADSSLCKDATQALHKLGGQQ
jgi:tetratricopeptide (TPR) repeat protein